MKFNFCPTCKSDLAVNTDGYVACQDEACNFVHYENPTPVVAAVIEYKDGNILLAHNVAWPPKWYALVTGCLLYTSPSPRDRTRSRMPSSA